MSGHMDRRTFLKRAAQVGVGALVVGTGAGVAAEVLLDRSRRPWDASSFPPPGRPKVAVVRAASYDLDLEGIVLDGLRAVGAEVAGRTVVLKPNFVEFDPGAAINTDPRLIAATVLAMRRLGAAEVTVAEGPGHRRDTQIVDGIVGMQGNGPIQGIPMQAGMLVFGADPVATDVTAARLMGFDPARVPSIAEAARFLGQGDPERIDQVGEDVERSAVDFATLPQFLGMKVGAAPGGGVAPGPA